MSFMISSAIVVPIAKTIASFLFGRIGDGFVDNTLIRRKTKIILAEDRKKINSLFKTEPEKEKWSKASFLMTFFKIRHSFTQFLHCLMIEWIWFGISTANWEKRRLDPYVFSLKTKLCW